MLAPAVGADRRFHPGADAADRLAVVPDWSTQTAVRHGDASSASHNFRRHLRINLRRPRLQGARLLNTALYTVLSVVLILPLSVALGLMVHQRRVRGGTLLRTVLFSTYMVPMIAVALVWSKLYSPTEGPLNQMLGWFGIGPQPWLSSPDTALVSIVLLNVWQQVGYFTVLAVAGLTQIPGSLYEAAKHRRRQCLAAVSAPITLPLLRRHAAVQRRDRHHQRGAGVRAGRADHPRRPGRLDQRAHLPHPPRRHRARRRAGSARRWR